MKASSKSLQSTGSTILKVILFLLLVYSPFFLHLGDLPIRIWDEARVIANTLEMSENGNYLVPHFEGRPEMWNTKPPLAIWCQLFFLKMAGNEEVSFRLPSAIAGFLTTLLILLVFTRYIKSYWFGFIAVLVLITANGYIGDHVTRTGDYDALLVLFMTFYALCFFLYTETRKQKFLHFFFVGLALAVLTKSIQGLLFLPALAVYLLVSRNLLNFLKNRWVYFDLVIVLIVVAGYYWLRESVNPGYLEAVFSNELGGRYLATTENHRHEFTYYISLLYNEHFGSWLLFVPLVFFTGYLTTDNVIRRLLIFSGILALLYLLTISFSGTKLAWYDAPLYPFLAIIAAAVIYNFFTLLSAGANSTAFSRQHLMPYIFLFVLFLFPYRDIVDKVYKPREIPREQGFYMISHYLQDAVRGNHDIFNHTVCYDGYNLHLRYYTDQLNKKGQHVTFADVSQLKEGSLVLFSQENIQKDIERTYFYQEESSHYNVKIYRINGTRSKKD